MHREAAAGHRQADARTHDEGGEGLMDWQTRAECARRGRDGKPFYDAELWQPIGTTGSSVPQIEDAVRVCALCTVRGECLDYALTLPVDYGILGGLTEWERASLKRRHARARAKAGVAAPPRPAVAPRVIKPRGPLVDAAPARKLIKDSGLSVTEAARRAGLDHDIVRRVLSGERKQVTEATLMSLRAGLAAVTS
jgi:WhiB family redox-sensing transcriptional regulator